MHFRLFCGTHHHEGQCQMYHRPLTANLDPVDEAEHRVEASIAMLAKALLEDVEIIVAVEGVIVSLEQAALFLKVAHR